jgi:hypothetical protein
LGAIGVAPPGHEHGQLYAGFGVFGVQHEHAFEQDFCSVVTLVGDFYSGLVKGLKRFDFWLQVCRITGCGCTCHEPARE